MRKAFPYLNLLLLLWGIVASMGMVSFTPISETWSELGLSDPGFREFLTYRTPPEVVRRQDSIARVLLTLHREDLLPDTLLKKRDVDTSSHHILLTGDSMSEGLMFAFRPFAKHSGHKLTTRIWYSSSTMLWAQTDSLADLIKTHKPDYVFFTLGSNELFIRDIKKHRDKFVKDILEQAKGVKFIWIGPPNWTEDTGINDMIMDNLRKDQFFLSRDLKFDRISDGAHPTRASSRQWADTIASWVMKESRYPIRLEKGE